MVESSSVPQLSRFIANPRLSRPLAVAMRAGLACLALVAGAPASAADWPTFRGPGSFGGASAPNLSGAGLELLWKRALGSAYSEIVTSGDVGVTLFADGTNDVVLAFDLATGADRWRFTLEPTYQGHDGSDDGPLSTPAIANGKVFAFSALGRLVALDLADGKLVWEKKFAEPDLRLPFYGVTSSPLPVENAVAGSLVVVETGGSGRKSVVALRQGDGSLAWSWGDDMVAYQSALLAKVGGEDQVVVFTNRQLAGLDPSCGCETWAWVHTPDGDDHGGQPVALGHDKFLLKLDDQVVVVEVAKDPAGGHTVREVWRNNSFQRNFAIPVLEPSSNTLFGFNGRFLTAVDAADGTVRWKSRPPGGFGLVLVGGSLVVLGDTGEVVLAKASPRGYEETARTKALEGQSYSPPTVVETKAGALVVVRDLTEMAALKVVPGGAKAAVVAKIDQPAPVAAVAALLARLETLPAAARQAEVDSFLAAHPTNPLSEPSGRITLLAKAQQDAGVAGTWNTAGGDQEMQRVEGTDLYYRNVDIEPRGIYEYRLSIDYGDPAPDPRNPLPIGTGRGRGSELRGPGVVVPAYLQPGAKPPAAVGRVEAVTIPLAGAPAAPAPAAVAAPAPAAGTAPAAPEPPPGRQMAVYLPAGYDTDTNRRYPLVLVNHGFFARDNATYPAVLDALIAAGTIEPMVVVMLPRAGGQEYISDEAFGYAKYLVEELVPELGKRYRLRDDAASRAIMGAGSAGQASVIAALSQPGAFGFVATQGFFRMGPVRPKVDALLANGGPENAPGAAAKAGLRAYVETSPQDTVDAGQEVDGVADNKALIEGLRKAGIEVTVGEAYGPFGWARFRAHLEKILTTFAPAKKG